MRSGFSFTFIFIANIKPKTNNEVMLQSQLLYRQVHERSCVCTCTTLVEVSLYLYQCMHYTHRIYAPGPPLPRKCHMLTGGRLFIHPNTTRQSWHTPTRKREIENAASCILSEPCWRFSWQSAKVGAAQTSCSPRQIWICQLNSLQCLFFKEAPKYDSGGAAASAALRHAYLCLQR